MDARRPSATEHEKTPFEGGRGAALRGAARIGILVICIALASSAAGSARATGDGADLVAQLAALEVGAAAPAPLAPARDTLLEDAGEFGAVARFIETANGPTPVPSPTPEPTLAPPPLVPERSQPVLVREEPPLAPPPASAEQPAAPPSPTAAPPPAASAPWGLNTATMDGYSQQLFNDTNARRVARGLPVLRANGYLIGIARIRSQDMADHNYFAHVSPLTGDNAFTLMDAHGVPYGWAGENLAKNNYTDAQAVAVADEALWNSAPHRENILNPNYTDMGIALVIDVTGMKYFTIIFTGPP